MTDRRSLADRAVRRYRRLLALFPSRYRAAVGEELCEVFRDEYVDVRRSGRVGAVACLWLRVIVDVAVSLPGAWRSELRGTGRGMGMGSWMRDLRVAARSLARRPGFALGVTLTLGLGIGATTTIYSVVDGVMIRPLPYDKPSTLVAVGAVLPGQEWVDEELGLQDLRKISVINYADFRERTRLFESSAVVEPWSTLLPDRGDGPEMVPAAFVSSRWLEVLGVSPVLGRTFAPDEYSSASEAVVMLSYGAWQRRYGSDRSVLGQVLERVGPPATIVGVLPRDFRAPEAFFPSDEGPEFWMPLQPDGNRYQRRGDRRVFALGHLTPGTSVEEARAEAARIATALVAEFPAGNVLRDGSSIGIGLNGLHAQTVGVNGRTLVVFLGAASLLVLLAAMNAATLFLARSLDRTREAGVRMALGAGRGRILRLLMGEAGILSVAGGALGVLLAYGGVGAFVRYAPSSIPRLSTVAVDGRVLVVAAVVSLGAGIAAGLLPAIRLARRGPWQRLQSGASSIAEPASRLRYGLVGGQLAVAVVLLSGAGLLFSSFMRLRAVEPGIEAEGLITMLVDIEGFARSSPEQFTSIWAAWDLALSELRSVPGVESVAGVNRLPFQAPSREPGLLLPGDTPESLREGIARYGITPGYLRIIGTDLLQGRDFEVLDGPDAEMVALVNEAFVRTQMAGGEALGVTIRRSNGFEEIPIRIVGVVEDVVQIRAEEGARAAIYVPYTQYRGDLRAVVQTSLPPETIVPELRRAAARFNPVVPLQDLQTMTDRMAATRTTPQFQAMLIGAFAAVALLLAAAGLYGSLAHSVGRRQRELGLRMALGADRAGVLRMVLGQGMRVSMVGLGLGMIATLSITRVISGFLYEVKPYDPATLLVVALVLLLVSAAACLAPARSATAVDPVIVLKAE